jgi:hypothetical protein
LAVTVIVVLTAGVLVRVSTMARNELVTADGHRRAGDAPLAIEHYRRAIRWSYPMNRHSGEAITALQSLARELEADGDRAGALLAWRSLSGSVASTRFLYGGSDQVRRGANGQIARLVAIDGSAAIDATLSEEQLAADHRRLLEEDGSPDAFWSTLLLLGMATWACALLVLAGRGFDSEGRVKWASARAPLWGALVGLVSFGLGLLFA